MEWITDKPKIAQTYGIWTLARLFFMLALPSIVARDTSQMWMVFVSFLLVILTVGLLHVHFMNKVRYAILVRYIGMFIIIGVIGNWLTQVVTDRLVLVGLSTFLIIVRTTAEYWLYHSLIGTKYASLKKELNFIYIAVISTIVIVVAYVLPPIAYTIVESIIWAITINLIYKKRKYVKV